MAEFVLKMLETERLLSAILLLVVVGFGWFIANYFWPWFTGRVDKSWDGWLDLKRLELEIESERNTRFASAWQDNNNRLLEMHQTVQTLVEGQKALIGTLLSFVDDRKLQDRLYKIFYEDGQ